MTLDPAAPPHAPALSVVLVTPGGYAEVRTTLRHLASQSMAPRMEILLLTTDPESLGVPDAVQRSFHSLRGVGVPTLRSLARAKARAVPLATAEYVAFAEDHSFPEPGWAEALVRTHERGYGGVAPEMKNANPAHRLSWVALFTHFGGNVALTEAAEVDYPWASHNMSYRRDALLELGDELPERMLQEGFLHDALRARGHRLCNEPAAATRHVNIAYLGPLLRHAWIGGRMYGGLRYGFGNWSLLRRLVYAGGSPLIPPIRLRRTLREIRRAGRGDLLPGILGPLTLILVVSALGEALGYLVGAGSSEVEYSTLEVGRDRFVPPGDHALWA